MEIEVSGCITPLREWRGRGELRRDPHRLYRVTPSDLAHRPSLAKMLWLFDESERKGEKGEETSAGCREKVPGLFEMYDGHLVFRRELRLDIFPVPILLLPPSLSAPYSACRQIDNLGLILRR